MPSAHRPSTILVLCLLLNPMVGFSQFPVSVVPSSDPDVHTGRARSDVDDGPSLSHDLAGDGPDRRHGLCRS